MCKNNINNTTVFMDRNEKLYINGHSIDKRTMAQQGEGNGVMIFQSTMSGKSILDAMVNQAMPLRAIIAIIIIIIANRVEFTETQKRENKLIESAGQSVQSMYGMPS